MQELWFERILTNLIDISGKKQTKKFNLHIYTAILFYAFNPKGIYQAMQKKVVLIMELGVCDWAEDCMWQVSVLTLLLGTASMLKFEIFFGYSFVVILHLNTSKDLLVNHWLEYGLKTKADKLTAVEIFLQGKHHIVFLKIR